MSDCFRLDLRLLIVFSLPPPSFRSSKVLGGGMLWLDIDCPCFDLTPHLSVNLELHLRILCLLSSRVWTGPSSAQIHRLRCGAEFRLVRNAISFIFSTKSVHTERSYHRVTFQVSLSCLSSSLTYVMRFFQVYASSFSYLYGFPQIPQTLRRSSNSEF